MCLVYRMAKTCQASCHFDPKHIFDDVFHNHYFQPSAPQTEKYKEGKKTRMVKKMETGKQTRKKTTEIEKGHKGGNNETGE